MQWVLSQKALPRRLLILPVITLVLALGLLTAKSSTGQPWSVARSSSSASTPRTTAPGRTGRSARYIGLTNSILGNVLNGGNGILVIGGGKIPADPDDVTAFWTTRSAPPSRPIRSPS